MADILIEAKSEGTKGVVVAKMGDEFDPWEAGVVLKLSV